MSSAATIRLARYTIKFIEVRDAPEREVFMSWKLLPKNPAKLKMTKRKGKTNTAKVTDGRANLNSQEAKFDCTLKRKMGSRTFEKKCVEIRLIELIDYKHKRDLGKLIVDLAPFCPCENRHLEATLIPNKSVDKAPTVVIDIRADWCDTLQDVEENSSELVEKQKENKELEERLLARDTELEHKFEDIISREVKRAVQEQQTELIANIEKTVREQMEKTLATQQATKTE